MGGLFQTIGGTVMNWLTTFINSTSAGLSSDLVPAATTALTIWFILFGYAVMRGDVHAPIANLIKRIVTFSIVLAIALSTGVYQNLIVSAVQGSADGLAQSVFSHASVSGGAAYSPTTPQSMLQLLDGVQGQLEAVFEAYLTQAITEATHLSFAMAIIDVQCGVFVYGFGVVLLLILGLEVIYVRFALAMVLALGPLFILCAAFAPTAKFFDAWVGKLANYVVLQVLIAAVFGLMMTAFTSVLNQSFYPSSATTPQILWNDMNAAGTAMAIVFAALLLAMLSIALPAIAAGLGGGASISGFAAFAGVMAGRAIAAGMGSVIARTSPAAAATGGSIVRTAPTPRIPRYQQAARDQLGAVT
jgi:type IV secretion system protein VirB6